MKCVICGNEVSKRKSLAYKDGRACRDHDVIVKMSQDRQKAQTKRLCKAIGGSTDVRVARAVAATRERSKRIATMDKENNQSVHTNLIWLCLQAVGDKQGVEYARALCEEYREDMHKRLEQAGSCELFDRLYKRHLPVVDKFFREYAEEGGAAIARYLEIVA